MIKDIAAPNVVRILKNFVNCVFEKKLSNKAKFVEKSKKINIVMNNNDSVAKLVALLKELFFENNPYIKHATARIAKVTSGTKRICIKLFSICRLIVRYN